jgi:hypothetical protein
MSFRIERVLINERSVKRTVDLLFRGIAPKKVICRESSATAEFKLTDNAKLADQGVAVMLSPSSVTSIQLLSP